MTEISRERRAALRQNASKATNGEVLALLGYADERDEAVALLREERSEREAQRDNDLGEGIEWSAQVHQRQIDRIDALLRRVGEIDE